MLLLIIGLLVFLTFSLIFGLKKRGASAIPEVIGNAEVNIGPFSFVQTSHGFKDWEMKATRAEVFEKKQEVVLKGVSVIFQGRQGDLLKLTGEEGTIDTLRQDFFLKKEGGFVLAEFSNGYTVKTSNLAWRNDQRMLVAEGAIQMTGPFIGVNGKGLRLAVDNQTMTVSGDVQAQLY